MSGSSIGEAVATFMNLRVGTAPRWTPPFIKANGEKVSSRLQFTAYKNGPKAKTAAKEQRKDRFTFVVWGALADNLARSLTVGKTFSCSAEPQQYTIDVIGANGQPVIGRDNTPLKQSKVSFVVSGHWIYGEDSESIIAAEIKSSLRPEFWNVAHHQHHAVWLEICKRRAIPYAWNGTSKNYGYATVEMPRERGVQINMQDHHAYYKNVIQAADPVVPVAPPATFQNQVITAANTPMQSYVAQQVITAQPVAPVTTVAQPAAQNYIPAAPTQNGRPLF